MPQIWGEGLRNSCRLSGEAESQEDRWNSCSSPQSRWEIFQQLSLDLFTSCLFRRGFFFLLISNKAEMNVCGNCRKEGAREEEEGKLQCCVLSLKISLVCVLLYTFHQPPITRSTWDGRLSPTASKAPAVFPFLFFYFCLAVRRNKMLIRLHSLPSRLHHASLSFLPLPSAPPFPLPPPQSICIMSICQTASVCSN